MLSLYLDVTNQAPHIPKVSPAMVLLLHVCSIKLPQKHWAMGYLTLTHDFTCLLY